MVGNASRTAAAETRSGAPEDWRTGHQVGAGVAGIELAHGARLGRYLVVRELGAGGMGVVYAARDFELCRDVALKVLRGHHPLAIEAFKREFRALADLSHPNLVALHELVALDGLWFFTMELVDGVDFLTHVKQGGDLRSALAQLAQGLSALHEAGRLHRDVKPSNVMVTRHGRVVLLDFGLATTLDDEGAEPRGRVLGTVPYLAPEQATSAPLTPAADWYGFGATMYEALTGRPPFDGSVCEILSAKQEREPLPPRALDPRVPPDLDALCMALLQRDAVLRPRGAEVIERLSGRAVTRGRAGGEQGFVGRARERLVLAEALEASRRAPLVAWVRGPSGIGKSALTGCFLEELRRAGAAVTLGGRCYERETVPYKGLDTVADVLSAHLRHLPSATLAALLPPDVDELARLFPALDWLGPRAVMEPPPGDAQERRRRGFFALRRLLGALAAMQPVVVALDDVQWIDADSAELLAGLIEPPDAPPVLWLFAYRDEDAEPSAPIERLARLAPPRGDGRVAARDLLLGPLRETDAVALAMRLFGGGGESLRRRAEAVARDATGNPYLVCEFARFAGGEGLGARPSVEELVWQRVRALPEPARRLLEIVAVAGGPTAQGVVLEAAELRPEQHGAVEALRGAHLVRTRGTRDRDPIETYHDRIREVVLARTSAEALRQAHRRLAVVLEIDKGADPELIASHFLAAGEPLLAGGYVRLAAGRAAAALAFDRAARLYRLALELTGDASLHAPLGEVLAAAGRGVEAAAAFVAAAEGAPRAEALGWRRRAADQYVRSGNLDPGLAVWRDVLAAQGMSMPESPRAAWASLLWNRARVRLRGTGFQPRDAADLPPAVLDEIDTCGALAVGLAIVDPIRAMDFQARHLLKALAAGEPRRVARALAAEAAYTRAVALEETRRSIELFARAEAIAAELGDVTLDAYLVGSRAIGAFQDGRWGECIAEARRALALYDRQRSDVFWEQATCRDFLCHALVNTGQLGELRRLVPAWLRQAEERDDLYAATSMRLVSVYLYLADDDPMGACAEVAAALEPWSHAGFQLQHWQGMYLGALAELYAGDAERARRRVEGEWPRFERSLLSRFGQLRVPSLYLRARLAWETGAPDRVKQLERAARRLEREHTAWARPLARLLDACLYAEAGDDARAITEMRLAAAGLDAAEMTQIGAMVRRRLGQALGGDEGARVIAAMDAALTATSIRRPAVAAATFVSDPWRHRRRRG